MKRDRLAELGLGVMQAAGDTVIIPASYLLLWSLEMETLPLPELWDPHTAKVLPIAFVGLLTGLIISGSYGRLLRAGPGYSALCMIRGVSIGSALTAAAIWRLDIPQSPQSFLLFVSLLLILMLIWRMIISQTRGWLSQRGVGRSRTIVFGSGGEARSIAEQLKMDSDLPYLFDGLVDASGSDDNSWREVLAQHQPELLLIPLHDPVSPPNELIQHCQEKGIRIQRVATANQVMSGQARINEFLGIPWELQARKDLRPVNTKLKRLFDLTFGAAAFVLLSPVFLGIAIWIKLDSSGPVFYRQIRLTKGGRQFNMYKFRSMVADAEQQRQRIEHLNEAEGPIFKVRRDPRITRSGRILRKYSLDELPQLLNVLRGELSLVGPRPPIPAEVEKYESWQLRRLDVVQGMTGLWQVSGRSRLSFEEMVLLDIYYIHNWSLLLDMEIILDTVPVVLFGQGAF